MKSGLRYDMKYMEGVAEKSDIKKLEDGILKAHGFLVNRNGPGKEYLGWLDLPDRMDDKVVKEIVSAADSFRGKSDVIVIAGIGGSYLGARALINAAATKEDRKKIKFAGYNMSGRQMSELLAELKDIDFSVNVISKSGTTTEPAIAFRMLESLLNDKYPAHEVKERVICTTDSEKGALRQMAEKKGYRTFIIPSDVGGRFSVLTPVGLFPAACAGIDVIELLAGAARQKEDSAGCDIENNDSYRYAAARNILYSKGKKIEVFSTFESGLHYAGEWWRQLFGESEGKDGRGIFPASCDFSTDLHSVGQLIQQGERNIFETFLIVEKASGGCPVPANEEDLDNINYLAGRELDEVNKKAYEATAEAHFEGGVPNSTIFIEERSPFCMGQLLYFFEKAVAISAYLSAVNPFDQPGVEAYKNKMFKLLGKPGI
jgi:glucose-6-phosphate isomerase